MAYVPERGDAIWLQFNPQAGHEQAGRRPALVLSPKSYNNKVGLLLCCPITNQVKGYPFEVQLPDDIGVTGIVLSDQVKSLDWKARNAAFIAKVTDDTVRMCWRSSTRFCAEINGMSAPRPHSTPAHRLTVRLVLSTR